MRKKIFITLGAALAILIISAFSIPYIFSEQIRVKIEQEIDKTVNADVTFDRISIVFIKHFPNVGLSLHNLKITGKDKFSGTTLASVKEFSFKLNFSSLFKEQIEVKGIHLYDPVIDIEVREDGSSNYDIFIKDTVSTSDTSSAVNLALDNIVIENGKISYNDLSLDTYLSLEGMNYQGQGAFEKEIFDLNTTAKIDKLTLDYGKVRYLNQKYVFTEMVVEMNTKENKFTFKENIIHVNHFKFGMEGYFTLLNEGYDINLKFATRETSFKNILSLVPGVYMEDFKQVTTKGDLSCSGFVKGKYSDSLNIIPAFHMDLNVKDAMFKVDSLPTTVNNIQLALSVDNPYGLLDSTVIDLKTFHMDLGKHPVHGKIKVKGLQNPFIDADILANLELAELEKIYPVKGIDLRGKLDFELQAKGRYQNLNDKKEKDLKSIPILDLNLQLSNGRIKYDSLPAAIENINLHLNAYNRDGITEHTVIDFKRIHMDMDKNPLDGYVRIEGYKNYKLDAGLKASLNLVDVERMYPLKGLTLKGMFNIDVKAKGIYNAALKTLPAIDMHVDFTDGYIKSDDYPEPMENIHLIAEANNLTGNFKDTKLDIQKLTYTLEDEPFEVSGTVKDMENYAYDIKVKGKVDLQKITRIYPVNGLALSGIIDSDIEVKGTVTDLEAGKYRKIASEGTIEVKDLTAKGDLFPQGAVIKDALFTFTPSKIILQKFTGTFGKSNISLSGDLTNYMSFFRQKKKKLITGDLKLTCDTLDLNEWISDQSATNTTSATNTSSQRASGARIGVWEVPKNLDFVFDSDIEFLKYEDISITRMLGEIRIHDGVLSLHETGFNTLNAKFSLSGDYDTRNIEHPLFNFKIDIDELDINRAYKELKIVRQLAPAAGDTYGVFSIDYTLSGELKTDMTPKTETLVGGGNIRIADAQINGMKMFEEISKNAKKKEINDPHMKDVVIVTEIRENKIYVKPFSMSINGFNTDIEGVNDMSGTITYLVKIELIPLQKLKIPFHVTGTYDNPKVELGKDIHFLNKYQVLSIRKTLIVLNPGGYILFGPSSCNF